MNVKFKNTAGKAVIITMVTSLTLTGCSFKATATKLFAKERLQQTVSWLEEVVDMGTPGTNELTADLNDVLEKSGLTLVNARLVRVVDGDTLVVDIDGSETKVRLIGVNTPESVAPQEYLNRTGKENTEAGIAASEYVKDLLAGQKFVYLEYDVQTTDTYGRNLAYAWLDVPEEEPTTEDIRTKMLNGILLDKGIAEMATYPPNVKYVDDFLSISRGARSER